MYYSGVLLEEKRSLNEYQIKFDIQELDIKTKAINKIKNFSSLIDKDNFDKFINYVQELLLSYYDFSLFCEFDNFDIEIVEISRDTFKENFKLLDSYSSNDDGCISYNSTIGLCSLLNNSNYLSLDIKDIEKCPYLYDNNKILNQIYDLFGLKFDYNTEYEKEEVCYFELSSKSLINPSIDKEGPLLVLTLHHFYEDGEPGYTCYNLKLVLHVII